MLLGAQQLPTISETEPTMGGSCLLKRGVVCLACLCFWTLKDLQKSSKQHIKGMKDLPKSPTDYLKHIKHILQCALNWCFMDLQKIHPNQTPERLKPANLQCQGSRDQRVETWAGSSGNSVFFFVWCVFFFFLDGIFEDVC